MRARTFVAASETPRAGFRRDESAACVFWSFFASTVVDDFDVPGAVVPPAKADSPLVVDPDAELPASIAAELLEPVAGRHAEVVQILGAIENLQLSLGMRLESTKPFRRPTPEEVLGVARSKRPNHLPNIV